MESAIYEIIGENIKSRRKEKGYNQDCLGKLVGLNRSSITNIESGRQRLLAHTLFELANVLKCEAKDLLPTIKEVEKNEITISDTENKKINKESLSWINKVTANVKDKK